MLDVLIGRSAAVKVVQRVLPEGAEQGPNAPAEGEGVHGEGDDALDQAALAQKEEGNAFYKSSQYEQAIESYTRGIEAGKNGMSPVVGDCYGNRALIHQQLKNWDDVIGDCTAAIERRPDTAKVYLRRARALQQLEKLKAAMRDARKAVELDGTGGVACQASTRIPLMTPHEASRFRHRI